MEYVRSLFKYIQDEWATYKSGELPDKEQWRLVITKKNTPTQENGFDCGVFTCMYADFISMGYELIIRQQHIDRCRNRIALSIMKGVAIE